MTLALDLGNSSLKAAFFAGPVLVDAHRFPTSQPDWPDAFTRWLAGRAGVHRVGLASVVPGQVDRVTRCLAAAGLPSPVPIHAQMPLPLRIAYATPDTLGADRIAAAVAAWNRAGGHSAAIALDAGTAVTYEVVRAGGVYAGGAIAPGPALLAASLHRGTAQLPDVPFTLPPSAVGDRTLHALQSGLAYGFLDGVTAMLARLRAELGPGTRVVATGGWAGWLAENGAPVDDVCPHLVLEGIRDVLDWQERRG